MDLKRKLSRLSTAGPGAAADARVEAIRARLHAMAKPPGPGRTVRQTALELPGALQQTARGEVHVIEHAFGPDHRHGAVPVSSALAACAKSIAKLALDPSLEGVDFRSALYLDTETTGLAGGTGTLAFLIGMAWFDGEALRVQQLFLRRPGEEAPMLDLLAERLAAASCLVTYNGKSFDWPLLRTRFVLNRMKAPELGAHLDLLHCARRIYRYRLPEVRLVHVEREVLGMERVGDIPGAEIPAAYAAFLRGARSAPIPQVIEHNAHDLVALSALLGLVSAQFSGEGAVIDPRDGYGMARVAARAGDVHRAVRLAGAVVASTAKTAPVAEALAFLGGVHRKRRDYEAAAAVLERALAVVPAGARRAAELHLMMAKLCEHRLRDFGRALEHARQSASAERAPAHARRVARLERRLAGA